LGGRGSAASRGEVGGISGRGRRHLETGSRTAGQMDRQPDRRTDGQADSRILTGSRTDGQTGRQTARQTDGQVGSRTGGQTDKWTERQPDSRADGQAFNRAALLIPRSVLTSGDQATQLDEVGGITGRDRWQSGSGWRHWGLSSAALASPPLNGDPLSVKDSPFEWGPPSNGNPLSLKGSAFVWGPIVSRRTALCMGTHGL